MNACGPVSGFEFQSLITVTALPTTVISASAFQGGSLFPAHAPVSVMIVTPKFQVPAISVDAGPSYGVSSAQLSEVITASARTGRAAQRK